MPVANWQLYQAAVVRLAVDGAWLQVAPAEPGVHAGAFPDPEGRTIHVITAHNPRGRTVPAADNARAHRRLTAELDALALSWWPAAGGDVTWTHVEESVAVVGLDDDTARRIGARYEQDAVFAWDPRRWRLLECEGDHQVTSGWSVTVPVPVPVPMPVTVPDERGGPA
ncbi:DUF3293 domain-containing protein [Nonomuraea dietziae]|uniref:DUF3293 domain-containing protein n=1 Tax=Nonomuraea dietziae TaxID=65515 RepID=UPI0033DEB294